jgi:hypothetical protein
VFSFEDFGEAMGLKGPRLILFWCLMPKGEKIKAKAIDGSATTWEILKIVDNSFIVSYVKSWTLVGRSVDYGKKGEFLKSLIKFLWKTSLYVPTSGFDLEIGIWVWFAKTNQVVA